MPGPSSNSLFSVQGYIDKDALPIMLNEMPITASFDKKFIGWDEPQRYGTRGETFDFKKPTRFSATSSLSFDAANTGSFAEERMTITADQEALVNYAATDVQLATYDKDGMLNTNAEAAINEIANKIERYSAGLACFGGYRFFGNFNVQTGQMKTIGEVTDAVARFRAFGGQGRACYIMPNIEASSVIQSSLAQFALDRNNELAAAGEIGFLGGVPNVKFYQSTLLPTHTAGTAADEALNLSTGYEITSVTPGANNTSVIVLAGMTNGTTIVENDMIQIGVGGSAATGAGPLSFLTYTGHITSRVSVQGRVTVGDTVSGGVATITIQPALIYDATEVNPARNLSRDIVTGASGDKLQIATSHACGTIYLKDYIKFACPKLPDLTPYPTGTAMSKSVQLSLRAYYGALMGQPTTQYVHDSIYGGGVAEEGVARILFYPQNS